MSVDISSPILGTERKETPPDQGEASEVNMSPDQKTHRHSSTDDRCAYSRIASFLAKMMRRSFRRAGSRQSSSEAAA
jgi:hypothetical protein